MKSWPKTPQATVKAFERSVPRAPAVVRKKMFGYPAAFVNGNMFASTFRDEIVVRLAGDDRAALLETVGAKPFEPMPGRPMTEYVAVPPSFARRPADLARWVERAHRYAAKLPPKTAARPAARAGARAAPMKKRAAAKPTAPKKRITPKKKR